MLPSPSISRHPSSSNQNSISRQENQPIKSNPVNEAPDQNLREEQTQEFLRLLLSLPFELQDQIAKYPAARNLLVICQPLFKQWMASAQNLIEIEPSIDIAKSLNGHFAETSTEISTKLSPNINDSLKWIGKIYKHTFACSGFSLQNFVLNQLKKLWQLNQLTELVVRPELGEFAAWLRLVDDPKLFSFLKEKIHQTPMLKERLMSWIERSKKEKAVQFVTADMFTILTKCGVQFNGADLRGIRVPGADLREGIFDHAQFQGADLTNVQFAGAWLRGADFSDAKMQDVKFGELPFLTEKSEIQYQSYAYAPDGKTFALGLENGNISLYDTANWEKIRTLSGHTDRLTYLVYSPDSKQLASSSYDLTIRLWDVRTRACRGILNSCTGQAKILTPGSNGERLISNDQFDATNHYINTVTSMMYSPYANQIAIGDNAGKVQVWDVENGIYLRTLKIHAERVDSIVYSANGTHLIVRGDRGEIELWEIERGICHHRYQKRHFGTAVSAPQGNQFVDSSFEEIRLRDIRTGKLLRTLKGNTNVIGKMVYSPSGALLASSGAGTSVQLWDIATGACLHTLCNIGQVFKMMFSPNGNQLACSIDHETVQLWDTERGTCIRVLTGYTRWGQQMMYSPQGDQFAIVSDDNKVRRWNVKTSASHHALSGHPRFIKNVIYSPKGDQIASSSWDKTIRLWDATKGICLHILRGHTEIVTNVAYSPNGDQIASSSQDKTIRLWEVETGACLRVLRFPKRSINGLLYSPTGNLLACSEDESFSGNPMKLIQLWDVNTSTCLHILRGHTRYVTSVSHSPNSDQLASSGEDGTVRLWDLKTDTCLHILEDHTNKVTSVVYSPQGDQLASSSDDKTVRLWEVETGTCLHILEGHTNKVTGVAYSPKGDLLASSSDDKTVRLWNVKTGQCQLVLKDFNTAVLSIAWKEVANHRYLVTGGKDRAVRQWQIIKEKEEYKALLCWSSLQEALNVTGAVIKSVRGLSAVNKQLLTQREALFLNDSHLNQSVLPA